VPGRGPLRRWSGRSRSPARAGSFVVDPYLDLGEVFQEREQDAVGRVHSKIERALFAPLASANRAEKSA
jgi:hypothetical protein